MDLTNEFFQDYLKTKDINVLAILADFWEENNLYQNLREYIRFKTLIIGRLGNRYETIEEIFPETHYSYLDNPEILVFCNKDRIYYNRKMEKIKTQFPIPELIFYIVDSYGEPDTLERELKYLNKDIRNNFDFVYETLKDILKEDLQWKELNALQKINQNLNSIYKYYKTGFKNQVKELIDSINLHLDS